MNGSILKNLSARFLSLVTGISAQRESSVGMQMRTALEKRKPFIVKCLLVTAVSLAVTVPFFERFTFSVDGNRIRCIEEYRFFLVDSFDKEIERGGIYAFESRGVEPFYEDGKSLAKFLVGLPGDEVEITTNQTTLVNGEVKGRSLALAYRLQQAPGDYVGKATIPEGEYWMMGDTPESFDSRYWGSIKKDQIIGRAHGIL